MGNLKKSNSFLNIIREEVNKSNTKSNGFRVPNDEDLLENGISNGKSYSVDAHSNGFRIPNDSDLFENELSDDKKSDSLGNYYSKEDVDRYLGSIVNTSDDYNSEEYLKVSGGNIITSLEKIQEMLMDGYVIKQAKCLSVNPSMISIVYEKIIKKSEMGKRR